MRKILSNCPVSCFADEISVSLDRQIQVLNELGIKFVEFRSADGTGVADFTDEQAKEAKKRLDAAGIRVSAFDKLDAQAEEKLALRMILKLI